MTEILWVRNEIVVAIHDEQLAEHGGLEGVRDKSLLESALARPQNMFAYDRPARAGREGVAKLAAAYAYGIVKNHPFIDGNKRTAFVCAELFLALNGFELAASDGDCVLTMLSVADGTLSQDDLAAWIAANIVAV